MGLAQPKSLLFTLEEYLEEERQAFERSEFIDGEIYAMAGESGRHGDISANFLASLVVNLRGTDFRARTKDTRVKSGLIKKQFGKGMISYPDIVVICGEPQYHDFHKDVVLNPTVIIEVLSESTEEFDRGVKFLRYRNFNETLSDYILVSQNEPLIEHYIRQPNNDWLLKEYSGLETTFEIKSINCTVKLKDIYDRIEF